MIRGPVAAFTICGVGRRIGRRLEVFFPGRQEPVLLPADEIDFLPGRVLLPRWLADRIRAYLPETKRGPEQ